VELLLLQLESHALQHPLLQLLPLQLAPMLDQEVGSS
jgi:hypothetical protein